MMRNPRRSSSTLPPLLLLVCCLFSGLALGLVVPNSSLPSSSSPRRAARRGSPSPPSSLDRIILAASRTDRPTTTTTTTRTTTATSAGNYPPPIMAMADGCFGNDERYPPPDAAADARSTSPPFANGSRRPPPSSAGRRRRTTQTLMISLLGRMVLVPIIARAMVSSSSTLASSSSSSSSLVLSLSLPRSSPAMAIGRRRISGVARSAIRHAASSARRLGGKRWMQLALVSAAACLFAETIRARRRQGVDATSEWGRYADHPALRGLALSALVANLVPYVALPSIIEKITGKSRGGDGGDDDYGGYGSREAYESSWPHALRRRGGGSFADGLLRLGPLYVKIGQILSCRKNLFPAEWITAMERLQDRVPAKSGGEAWDLLYEACPGGKANFHRTFADFDDVPLAAASLGQVHRGILRSTGAKVAIKIQRSRLRDIYDKDLALMKKIAIVVDSFFGKAGRVGGVEQSWSGIFGDAESILYREIDYRDEADNAARFASDFGIGIGGAAIECAAVGLDGNRLPSAAGWMRTPYTYRELSSEKFLVMEYVPSIKVSDDEKLDAAGVTLEDREYLAEALARSYLRQFCANGFFSTDPHPGNLGVEVLDDGGGGGGGGGGRSSPRLVFYDFGQACSLANDQAGGILEVIESIIDSDASKSVSAFGRMGVLKDNADLDKVRAKCQQNYDTGMLKVKKRRKRSSGGARYAGRDQSRTETDETVDLEGRLDAASIKLLLDETTAQPPPPAEDVNDAEIMGYFTLQSEYAFVARALSQLDGVGKGLDPEFDFISAAAPHLVEVKGTGRYLVDEMKKRLKFVYDPDDGMLAKEMALFKSLGFDPAATKC